MKLTVFLFLKSNTFKRVLLFKADLVADIRVVGRSVVGEHTIK